MAKKMIIKGVGTMMAKKVSADGKGIEVITLGTLQNLRIDFNVEIDDIFGGDGLFAIDTLIRSKSVEVSATDAKFDLEGLRLMQGSNIQEQVSTSLWVLGEQAVAVGGTIGSSVSVAKVPVEFGDSLFGDGNFAVRLKDSNKLLTKKPFSASTAPTAEDFYIESLFGTQTTLSAAAAQDATSITVTSAAGLTTGDEITVDGETVTISNIVGNVLTVTPGVSSAKDVGDAVILPSSATNGIVLNPSAVNADVVFNYQRTEVGVDVIDLITDEVPFPVHVIHHGSFLQKNGDYAGIETELYSCIAQGQFSIDAQRASASASTIALKVIDPERADKKLGSIKRYTSLKRV
jgi:hypothetical protein